MANGDLPIGRESRITISLAVALISVLLGSVVWIKDELTNTTTQLLLMDSRLQSIERSVDTKYATLETYIAKELSSIRNEIDSSKLDRFYRYEFENWIELLKVKNETLSIPDIQKH